MSPGGLPAVLVRPPAAECVRLATTGVAPPLGLAYVAAALEAAGARVSVVDAVARDPGRATRYLRGHLLGLPLDEISAFLPQGPCWVGIGATFTHEWPAVARLARLIRRDRPRAFIAVGGEHATALPELCLATAPIDCVALGEGEETAVELWRAASGDIPLSGVPGIAYRAGGRSVRTPPRPRIRNVDSIAEPAWHLFDLGAYHRAGLSPGVATDAKSMPLLATRGCPYECSYCSSPGMWTRAWRPRDPVRVVDEIEGHVRRHGARSFALHDLTAIVRRDWIAAFCRELLRRDLRISWQFPSGTRCEVIDAEIAGLLRLSGVVAISFAPESGSDRTRERIKKRMRAESLLGAVGHAADAGLDAAIFLVLGFPGETARSLAEGLPFLRAAARAGARDASVGYYMALPGTELFRELRAAGRLRLDRAYFAHILQGTALFPSLSHCAGLGRIRLFLWKLRHLFEFYRHRRPGELLGPRVRGSLARLLRALLDGARARVAPRWASRAEEAEIDGWEALLAD